MTKRIAILLGLAILLNFFCHNISEGYIVVDNRASLSYTNVAGVSYYDTSSDTVQIWLYAGPTMGVTKTTKNLRSGDVGSNTTPIGVVPGDTAELYLSSQNTGDTYAYWITIIDTFPSDVGDSTTRKLSYVVGSETCAIQGSMPSDSISWCTDALHTWSEWQICNETVRLSILSNCTGIRWRWNVVVHSDPGTGGDSVKSCIRVRYQWFRNNN